VLWIRIRIRIILGSWIRIRSKVKSWMRIRIRIKVKSKELQRVILEHWRGQICGKVCGRIRILIKLKGRIRMHHREK
jgi:hypothetical protein